MNDTGSKTTSPDSISAANVGSSSPDRISLLNLASAARAHPTSQHVDGRGLTLQAAVATRRVLGLVDAMQLGLHSRTATWKPSNPVPLHLGRPAGRGARMEGRRANLPGRDRIGGCRFAPWTARRRGRGSQSLLFAGRRRGRGQISWSVGGWAGGVLRRPCWQGGVVLVFWRRS